MVLAAGSGRRLGAGNKALLRLGGEPLLAYSLRSLAAAPSIAEIVLVMPPEDVQALHREYRRQPADFGVDTVVDGGSERWLSSRSGCLAANPLCPFLLVHDAARPFLSVELVEAVSQAARREGCALAAEPLADTLKRDDGTGRVALTVPRAGLWRAQTPQAARREVLLEAFRAWSAPTAPTDEAMLLEALSLRPALVPAPASNFKITTGADWDLAQALVRQWSTAARD